MSKQGFLTVSISVILSVVVLTAANLVFDRQREPVLPDVVRAKSVELIDAQGRIRGVFELAKAGQHGDLPRLVMRDDDGRDSLVMGLDVNGNGALEFASEHWNEGAVILGHLNLVDVQSIDHPNNDADKQGAWGLQIRSPQDKYTDIGFFNSGRPIVPLTENSRH